MTEETVYCDYCAMEVNYDSHGNCIQCGKHVKHIMKNGKCVHCGDISEEEDL